jgi:hypothetical protein
MTASSTAIAPSVMAASVTSRPLEPRHLLAAPRARSFAEIERFISDARMLYLVATAPLPMVA